MEMWTKRLTDNVGRKLDYIWCPRSQEKKHVGQKGQLLNKNKKKKMKYKEKDDLYLRTGIADTLEWIVFSGSLNVARRIRFGSK